jgi:hypothetical protein
MTMSINGREAQRKALVVGISDYTSLQQLDFCKNDGTGVYEVLTSLGYKISDENKLVGEAKGERVGDTIYDFFVNNRNTPDDTLLFYYSGYVVPDVYGDVYLALSDIDFDNPYKGGISYVELTKVMQKCISTRVVIILDCCYRGSAMVTMNEKDSAKVGEYILDEKSRKLPGQGKYILSSNETLQEAYALTTGQHSIFTYYLLEGLRGKTESIDIDGNVTPQSLGDYLYRKISSLPIDVRPKRRPMLKTEKSGNVILASYPELRPTTSVPNNPMYRVGANVVPILNGKDSDVNSKYLGPKPTRIYRYLLVLWVAKSTPMFSLWGKEIDNSIYFTLYKLWQVADSFRQFGPYHLPIHYDRTKAAIKIYTMLSDSGLVDIKKIDGDTYVTTTKKGDDCRGCSCYV